MNVVTEMAGGARKKYVENSNVDRHSIFWDRRIPGMEIPELQEMCAGLHVDHIVIGHTPQKGIKNYGNLAFNIDVGMSPKYGEGEPAAIVFKENTIVAFYARRGEKKITISLRRKLFSTHLQHSIRV
jgi:hypothetical protein